MQNYIFCDVKTCPLKINRCFGGTYRLHLHSRRISQVRNHSEACIKHSCANLNGLHGVIFQYRTPYVYASLEAEAFRTIRRERSRAFRLGNPRCQPWEYPPIQQLCELDPDQRRCREVHHYDAAWLKAT
jgi:hypothetical protein